MTTLKFAKEELEAIGMTITKTGPDGDYKVNFAGGEEATAYYTDGIEDAMETAHAMAASHKKVMKLAATITTKQRTKVSCDRCSAAMINGVFCHETGCPNTGARFDPESQSWVKQRKCFECGGTIDADDPCCSAPVEEEEPPQITAVFAVHVAREALPAVSESLQKHELAVLMVDAGSETLLDSKTEIFSMGPDDLSFEVPNAAVAVRFVDALNEILPASGKKDGYGYGSSFAATAASYNVFEGDDETDRFTAPNDWNYKLNLL